MDEFLGKLAADQRRFQQFLRTKASRLTRMGEALARCRSVGARILVVGEPPLDRIASFVAAEYLDSLGARDLALGATNETTPGRRDVVLVLAHEGSHPGIGEIMGLAGARGARVLLIGSVFARDRLRARTDLSLGLPMKGAKTIGEASLVLARILARIARGLGADSTSDAAGLGQEEPAALAELVEARGDPDRRGDLAEDDAPESDEPVLAEAVEAEPDETLVNPAPAPRGSGRMSGPDVDEPMIELLPFSDIVPVRAAAMPPPRSLPGPAPLPTLRPAPSSLLASVRPMLRFALGDYPEDASGPAHQVEALTSDGVTFVLDPDDETGATLDTGDELWVRLELDVVGEHLNLRGRVRSVELAGTSGDGPVSRVQLVWAEGSDLRRR